MAELTEEGRRRVEAIAARHGVSLEAALTVLAALAASGGGQAQFNHPEFGGMGQWSRGGMVMVGDMFNNALKARVDALCTDLAELLAADAGPFRPSRSQSRMKGQGQMQGQGQGQGGGARLFVQGGGPHWWPEELGQPSAVGAQNDLAYAYFPGPRRLAIRHGGAMRIFDTGPHEITGVSQQQGPGQSLTFTSRGGAVSLAELRPVEGTEPAAPRPEAAPPREPGGGAPGARDETSGGAAAAPGGAADPVATIERLAALRDRGVLTEEEFAAKKAELLARL